MRGARTPPEQSVPKTRGDSKNGSWNPLQSECSSPSLLDAIAQAFPMHLRARPRSGSCHGNHRGGRNRGGWCSRRGHHGRRVAGSASTAGGWRRQARTSDLLSRRGSSARADAGHGRGAVAAARGYHPQFPIRESGPEGTVDPIVCCRTTACHVPEKAKTDSPCAIGIGDLCPGLYTPWPSPRGAAPPRPCRFVGRASAPQSKARASGARGQSWPQPCRVLQPPRQRRRQPPRGRWACRAVPRPREVPWSARAAGAWLAALPQMPSRRAWP